MQNVARKKGKTFNTKRNGRNWDGDTEEKRIISSLNWDTHFLTFFICCTFRGADVLSWCQTRVNSSAPLPLRYWGRSVSICCSRENFSQQRIWLSQRLMVPTWVWLRVWTVESSSTWETLTIPVKLPQPSLKWTDTHRSVYPASMFDSFGEQKKVPCVASQHQKLLLNQCIPLESY